MTRTVTNSADYSSHSATNGVPRFRAVCPHCNRVNEWPIVLQEFATLGSQISAVKTCNHEIKENGWKTVLYKGCGKRYALDATVALTATATVIQDPEGDKQ